MKSIKQYTTVLFDLDGTLLDTLGDLAASINFALEQHRFPAISEEDTRRYIGNGYAKLIERAIPSGVDNPNFDRCLEEFGNHYSSNMMTHTKPYPGILELLAELKTKNCRMAVVSNKNDSAVKALVEHFFEEYIQVAIGESAEVARKPDPAMVHNALKELGVDKSSAVYVGDSDVDIFTAQNAGLPCICVGWGFRDKELLEQNGAKYIIDQPTELLALLEERF